MKTAVYGVVAWLVLSFLLMASLHVTHNEGSSAVPAPSFLGCFAVVGVVCVVVGMVRSKA